MPDRRAIYQGDPWTYDELISYEDHEGNILKALKKIRDFSGLDIADIGAGTGRLALLLAPYVRSVLLTDSAEPMLRVAEERLRAAAFDNFQTRVSDLSHIPVPDHSLDAVVEGWALCTVVLRSDSWSETLRRVLQEMQRSLKPGGTMILLETLGTGQEHPSPPNDRFAALYVALEEEHGFEHTSIRTDYQFPSLAEKNRLLTFFFDREMLDAGVQTDALTYPECTGVWFKTISGVS